jgi:hypothetical protein
MMSEKHKRFMAELRTLLERYSAMLNPPMGSGNPGWSAFVVYADDDVSEPDCMAPHFIYDEEGNMMEEEE